MELFRHDTNIDWVGKAKYFLLLSILLLVVGLQSWIRKGSLDYGIDFRGGTAVYVRFAGTPPVDQLRAGLAQEGLGRSVIQRISDIGNASGSEVVIYLPQEGEGDQALDAGKRQIDQALHQTLGGAEAGKQETCSFAATPCPWGRMRVIATRSSPGNCSRIVTARRAASSRTSIDSRAPAPRRLCFLHCARVFIRVPLPL
jgi:hypothetical protein